MELIAEMRSTERDVTQSEIEHYLNMRVPSEFDDKPLWPSGIATKSLPILSTVAQIYLGTSSSSVPDEPVFSTTEIISNGKRSSIGPEKLNRVVFIHYNVALAVDECK